MVTTWWRRLVPHADKMQIVSADVPAPTDPGPFTNPYPQGPPHSYVRIHGACTAKWRFTPKVKVSRWWSDCQELEIAKESGVFKQLVDARVHCAAVTTVSAGSGVTTTTRTKQGLGARQAERTMNLRTLNFPMGNKANWIGMLISDTRQKYS